MPITPESYIVAHDDNILAEDHNALRRDVLSIEATLESEIENLASVSMRQTVLAGAAGSSGAAAFLAVSGTPVVGTANAVPVMTSNTAPSGVASASTEFSATFAAWKAFNNAGGGSNHWNSSGAALPQWVRYQFTSAKTIARYGIKTLGSAGAGTPTAWQFQGSNDGSSWTTLDSRSGQSPGASETQYDCLTATGSYTYYRLYVTAVNSGSEVWVEELTMYEQVYTSIDIDGSPMAVTISFAAGFDANGAVDYIGQIASDVSDAWSSLGTSTTKYLYVDRDATTGALTYGNSSYAPKYQAAAPSSPSADQHWFDLGTFKMKRYTGSAWEEKQRVFVGEVTTNGSGGISSVTTYALMGAYAPGRIAASASTATTKSHNIGCDVLDAQCFQATSAGGSLVPVALTGLTAKTVSLTTGASVVEISPVVRRAF